ncbi:MAG: hypothetical protein IJ180_09520 [Bacteroidales bacterium]|nr:hypothetical protein [Bacteroidales bacterium]
MRKKLFKLIKEKLFSIIDTNGDQVIKHVDLYNSQMMYIQQEQPFLTPAVFIEFSDISWKHQLHGVKEATINIRLHVITDSRVGHWQDAINVFDLLSIININLYSLSSNEGIGAFTLTNSITDSDFDELQHNIETYTTHITDNSVQNPIIWLLITGYWNDVANWKDNAFWKDDINSSAGIKVKLKIRPN